MRAAHHIEDDAITEDVTRRLSAVAVRVIAEELKRRGLRCIADDQAIRAMVRRLSSHRQEPERRTQGVAEKQTFVEAGVARVASSVSRIAQSMTASMMERIERKAAAQGLRLSDPERLRAAVRAGAARYLVDEIERQLLARRTRSGPQPTRKGGAMP